MTATETEIIRLETAEDVSAWGGFTDVGRWLSEWLGVPYGRQRVYSLWRWRTGNGFPERHLVRLPDGRVKWWFRRNDVRAWARTYKVPKQRAA